MLRKLHLVGLLFSFFLSNAQTDQDSAWIKDNYTKKEIMYTKPVAHHMRWWRGDDHIYCFLIAHNILLRSGISINNISASVSAEIFNSFVSVIPSPSLEFSFSSFTETEPLITNAYTPLLSFFNL